MSIKLVQTFFINNFDFILQFEIEVTGEEFTRWDLHRDTCAQFNARFQLTTLSFKTNYTACHLSFANWATNLHYAFVDTPTKVICQFDRAFNMVKCWPELYKI